MSHTGPEQGSVNDRNDSDLQESGKRGAAKCAANADDSDPIDPDLTSVVDDWPKLSEAVKARILGIVEGPTDGDH